MGFESGGYAEKLGNRYEGRWVVRQLLMVLAGRLRSVVIEAIGDDEAGVDLWVETHDNLREAQQCKAQIGSKSQWTMADLYRRSVLTGLSTQLSRSLDYCFSLVSSIPAVSLRDLSQRARDSSGDPNQFFDEQLREPKELRAEFLNLCRYLQLDPEIESDLRRAFDFLRRSGFHIFSADREDELALATWASTFVDGEPAKVIASLADFAETNLRKTITAELIRRYLETLGYGLRDLARDSRTSTAVEQLRRMFCDSIADSLAGGTLISRTHAHNLFAAVQESTGNEIIVLHGRAGLGKSGVLFELTKLLEKHSIPHLPFRLDRQPPIGPPRQYGETWGLPESPSICLSQLAGDGPSVLILDQMDAIRWTSAHVSDPWLTCKEIIQQANRLGNVRVIVSCRTFDLKNDPQFVAWARNNRIKEIPVGELGEGTVREVAGDDFGKLTAKQRNLLRSAQNLGLWLELRKDPSTNLADYSSTTGLMRQFWDHVFRELEKRSVAAEEVQQILKGLIDRLLEKGSLGILYKSVQHLQKALRELESLNVVSRSGDTIVFCHQSYGDYLAADRVVESVQQLSKESSAGPNSVLEWLGKRDVQSLFRREQLRLLLSLLRDEGKETYLDVIRALVSSNNVRFHLKHLCVSHIGQIEDPTDDEAGYVVELLQEDEWREHVESIVLWRNCTWMQHDRLKNLLQRWLEDGGKKQNEALWLLRVSAPLCGDLVAEMLEPYENAAGDWPDHIDGVLWHASHEFTDKLYEMWLRRVAVGRGWGGADWTKLARETPVRCLPTLRARFLGILCVLQETAEGKSDSSNGRSESALGIDKATDMETLEALAVANAGFVWNEIAPLVLQIVRFGRDRFQSSLSTRVYRRRRRREQSYYFLQPLFRLLVAAGRTLASQSATDFLQLTSEFSIARSRFAQGVVAASLLGCKLDDADHVISWLLANPKRLILGNPSHANRCSPARRLLRKFSGAVSKPLFNEIERLILEYRPPDEKESFLRRHRHIEQGWCKDYGEANLYGALHFFLLKCLPRQRMSDVAVGTLGVAHEKFWKLFPGYFDRRPKGAGGFVRSPIPPDRLHFVSDRVWLKIINRYTRNDERQFYRQVAPDVVIEANAETFSRDLGHMAKRQPSRFAKLALRIPKATSSKYLTEIMRGLDAKNPPDDLTDRERISWAAPSAEDIEAVFEHARMLGHKGLDSTLCDIVARRPDAGWSKETIEHICDLARNHPEPGKRKLVVAKQWKDRSVNDLENGAINHVRGPAAIAINALLEHDKGLWMDFGPTIDDVIEDAHPGVRTAAIRICLTGLEIDRELAIARFLKACNCGDDRILATREAMYFVNATQREHLAAIRPIIAQTVNSTIDEVAEYGARRVTHVWIHQNEMKDALDSCINGTTGQRKGVAAIATENFTDVELCSKCQELLRPLLEDDEADVREEARSFLDYDGSLQMPDMPSFIDGYLLSRSYQDEVTKLLRPLQECPRPVLEFRNAVFNVCDTLATSLADQTRGFSSRLAHEVDEIPPLLLRLYDQAQDAGMNDVQSKCLDTWDLLLQHRVGGVRELLKDVDGEATIG